MLKFFFCSIVFLSFSVRAQLTISQFIGSAEHDIGMKSFTGQLEYLATKPYRLSPIQKLELRTRTNELDLNRQDYAVRVNPANPWEVRNSNNYFKAYQQALTAERTIAFKGALVVRYTLAIEMLYFQMLKNLKEENRQLTDKQVAILEGQRASTFFDSKDYLELKVDQMTDLVELEETRFDLETQAKRIAIKFQGAQPVTMNWENESIISVEGIHRAVDSLLRDELPSAAIAYQEQRINVAMKDYKLEKSNIGIGYIQTQYQPYRTDQNREPWNIAVGVTIPIFNPNKGDMAKKQLDVIESQFELEEEKAERKGKTAALYEELKGELIRYKDIGKKISDLSSGALATTLQQMDSGNPIIRVRFDSNLIKLKTLQLKLYQSILLTYIDLLAYTDRLQNTPLVNYLSEDLAGISEGRK